MNARMIPYGYKMEKGIIGINEGMCLGGLVMPVVVNDMVFTETLYRIYDLTKRQAGEEA